MVDCSRRDFIRLTSCALGGVLLTGCGGGSSSSSPNGYRFYRLASVGSTVGSASRPMNIAEFGGSVHISAGGLITFDAFDAAKRHGLFQLEVDFSFRSPMVVRQDTTVITGQILSDLRTVRDFATHDVDGQGNVAVVLQPQASGKNGHYFGGLYYKPVNAEVVPLLIYGDELDGGDTVCSGQFGDLALCENNGILVAASHLPKAPGAGSGGGLLHLPTPAGALGATNRLLGVEDFISSTDYMIQGFGILDVGLDGTFAVSANASSPDLLSASNSSGSSASHHCLLTGHLSAPNDHMLLAAPPLMTTAQHSGAISYGPRVGADGTVSTKVGGYGGSNLEALIMGDQVIRRTDSAGPFGEYAASFTPGAAAADGSYYYTQYVENADGSVGVDLLMYDGSVHTPLLSVGDRITNVDQPVSNIVFATTTNHVDGDNRIVLLCQFLDGTTGLVVGVPV